MTNKTQLMELKKELDRRFAEGYRSLVGCCGNGLPPTLMTNEKHAHAMHCLKDIIASQKAVNELLDNQADNFIIVEIPKDADELDVARLLSGMKPLPQDWKAVRVGELSEPTNIYEAKD